MSKNNKIYSKLEKFFILVKKSFFIAWYRHHLIVPPRSLYKYAKSFVTNIKRGNGISNLYTNRKSYFKWYKENMKDLNEDEMKQLKYKPKFSFVVPCFNVNSEFMKECIESLLNQSYKNFEVVICDDGSTEEETLECLKSYESKVCVVYNKENKGISEATNSAINNASGEYIVFVDNDDVVHRDALYYLCYELNENKKLDFLYTDEDKIDFNGSYIEPYFKSDFALDNFLVNNYFNHLTCVRKSLLDEVGLFRTEFNGAQDYDLYLRIVEQTKNICHIDKVLYH